MNPEELATLYSLKGLSTKVSNTYCEVLHASYGLVALDYDGTLTEDDDWQLHESCSAAVSMTLQRAPALVISGRGDSLLELLRPLYHEQLLIGSYNGNLIRNCQGKVVVDRRLPEQFVASAQRHATIQKANHYCVRGVRDSEAIEQMANDYSVAFTRTNDGWIVCAADKEVAIQEMEQLCDASRTLKVGNEGHSGGNDARMLAMPYSFSADTINKLPSTCFPVLNSRGGILKNATATAYLLSRVTFA